MVEKNAHMHAHILKKKCTFKMNIINIRKMKNVL